MMSIPALRAVFCLSLLAFALPSNPSEPIDTARQLIPVDASKLPNLAPTPGKTASVLYVYGGPSSDEGTFQDGALQPNWQGWTTWDPSLVDNHWHASQAGYASGPNVVSSVVGSGAGTSVAHLGDINGDGLSDVGVTSLTSQPWRFAQIYFGDSFVLFNADEHIPEGPPGAIGPEAIYGMGDINGDGFDDVLIQWFGFEWRVYLGDPTGVRDNTAPDLTFSPSGGLPVFAVRGVGDVNDDGFDDFVVYRNLLFVGLQLQLHFGSASPDATPDLILSPGSSATIGLAGGDVNGDGYSDICVIDASAMPGTGSVYFGGALPDNTSDVTLLGPSADRFGTSLCVVEVDGELGSELIVGAPNETYSGDVARGVVYLYEGGIGFDGVPEGTLTGVEALDNFGKWVAPAGDKNADGYGDFVVSSVGSDVVAPDAGAIYLVEGGPNLNALSSTILGEGAAAGSFGDGLAGSGDYNNDGCLDFLVARYEGPGVSSQVDAVQVNCEAYEAYWGVEAGTPGFVTTPGYGNDWQDRLGWYHDAPDPGTSTEVRLHARVWVQTEIFYDEPRLNLETDVGPQTLDLIGQGLSYVDVTHTVQPADYVTSPLTGNPAIYLSFLAASDDIFSDEDTDSSHLPGPGGVLVDNVRVWFDGSLVSHATWNRLASGPLDPTDYVFTGLDADGWQRIQAPFFGDFAKLVSNFNDIDPDRDNLTPQVSFIDDGTPPSNDPLGRSTGGSTSTTSYGVPGNYVVNHTGGLSGGTLFLDNRIVSPEIVWDDSGTSADDGYNDAVVAFDLWGDIPLENEIFYVYYVRSFPSGGSQWSDWDTDFYVYYSDDAKYSRATLPLTPFVEPSDEKIQVALAVHRLPLVLPGDDTGLATPGPLFDNVSVYKFFGASNSVPVPTGSSVGADAGDVDLTFDQVTAPGNVSVEEQGHGPLGDATFRLASVPLLYYDLSTTATFTGNVEICIHYDENALAVAENELKLFHFPDQGPWKDVTTSLDTNADVICGVVTELSPFTLGADPDVVATERSVRLSVLHAPAPNPFNPRTTLRFELAGTSVVDLLIYDAAGRRVAQPIRSTRYPAGEHSVQWDGRDASGALASSGVYFGRLVVDGEPVGVVQRMVLLR